MDDAEPHAGNTMSGDAVPKRARLRWVGLTALVLIAADQITKAWALSALESRDIDLVWTARFHLIFNHGSAFGLGNSYGRWVGLLVIGVVIALLLYVRTIGDRLRLLLIGTVVGGAIGNLIDRLVRAEDGFLTGGVIDFIDFQWWPVFNVADMGVVLGAIGLVIVGMLEPDPEAAADVETSSEIDDEVDDRAELETDA